LSDKLDEEQLATKCSAEIRDGEATARAFEPALATVRQIMALKIHEVKVIDIER
jgi:hypothetical protein